MSKKIAHPMVGEVLGRRIGEVRTGRMSQRELAERVGLRREAVTQIENGNRQVTVDELLSIAKALNIRPQDLLLPAEGEKQTKGKEQQVAIGGEPHGVSDVRAWFGGRPLKQDVSSREILEFLAELPQSELQPRIQRMLVRDADQIQRALVDRKQLAVQAGDLAWEIKEGEALREALRLSKPKAKGTNDA